MASAGVSWRLRSIALPEKFAHNAAIMSRTGLIIALALGSIVGVVFGLHPSLDIEVARFFYNSSTNTAAVQHVLKPIRYACMALVWVVAAPTLAAPVIKLIWPRRRLLVPGRAVLLMTATLALGPGILVNAVLKDHWGRPRPEQVLGFGGHDPFVAWWDTRGVCPHNCSFVSGDVSFGTWTLASATLVPPPWRAVAYTAALAFSTGIAVLRMLQGGHFFTDTVFGGVFTFLIVWVVYHLIYRWRATRITDDQVEQWLEWLVLPRSRLAPRTDAHTQPDDDRPQAT